MRKLKNLCTRSTGLKLLCMPLLNDIYRDADNKSGSGTTDVGIN